MPELTSIEGTVTAAYRSGLKVDRVWRPYSESFRKVDLRASDKVRCSLDGQGRIAELVVTERGDGVIPVETMPDSQKDFLRKLLDDRELTPQALERDFLVKYVGRRLDELCPYQGRCLLDLLTGRTEPFRPKGGGRRRS